MEDLDLQPTKDAMDLLLASIESQTKLAEQLGVTRQAVSKFIVQGFFPMHHAVTIEELYGIKALDLVLPQLRYFYAKYVI